jgi:CheY-like chemotaxis protein
MLRPGQDITRAPTAAAHVTSVIGGIGSDPRANMPTFCSSATPKWGARSPARSLGAPATPSYRSATGTRCSSCSITALAPDVVVSELAMPRVDGLRLLRALRDAEPTHDLPVLVSSSTDQARRRAATEDAWLDTPADPATLLSAIEQLLHARRPTRPRCSSSCTRKRCLARLGGSAAARTASRWPRLAAIAAGAHRARLALVRRGA